MESPEPLALAHQQPPKWFEQFRTLTEYKIYVGFSTKVSLEGTTFEFFRVLLILLQVFPKLENFDNITITTYIGISRYLEIYLRQLALGFKLNPVGLIDDNFDQTSSFRMRDLLFLFQNPTLLFKQKVEFKYCYINLVCLINVLSIDKQVYFKHVSLAVNSLLQSKPTESDTECIGRFILPFSQMVYEGCGLVDHNAIVSASLVYGRFIKKEPKVVPEQTFLFLNLIKFTHVKGGLFEPNILSKTVQTWSEVILGDKSDSKQNIVCLLQMITFHHISIQISPALLRHELSMSNQSGPTNSMARAEALGSSKSDSRQNSFTVEST